MAHPVDQKLKTNGFSRGWLLRRSWFWQTWVKSITLMVSASFIFPTLAFAFEAATYPVSAGKLSAGSAFVVNGAAVDVSAELGRVVSSFRGKSGKTVVYIHDLHCNYEVQSNIAALLGTLAKKNGLRLIGVEGESRTVNVRQHAEFPRPTVKTNVGQYFLKRGRITGSEYLAATGHPTLLLEGVEDQALYEQDKTTLLKFLGEKAQGYCGDLKDVIEKLKAPLYSTDLAKVDHFREQFEGETISLETYCQFLLEQSRKQGVALATFPHMNLFAQTQSVPVTTDSDYNKLVDDAADLDQAVRERLYTSPDQRRLDHYADMLKIMADMLAISATAKELDYYRAHREEFSITTLVGFLDNLAYRNGVSSTLDTGVVKLDEYLKLAGHFYEVADQRSEAFVQNILGQMNRHQQTLAVLITGGYHNQQVEAALKKQSVSFLTIKPRLTHTYDENPYFSLLLNRRAPAEALLAQSQNMFAPPSAFNELGFVKYWKEVREIYKELEDLLETGHDSEAFLAKHLQALDAAQAGSPAFFNYQGTVSNLKKRIYAFPVQGSDYAVVLRPAANVTDNSAYLPFIQAKEDLGNGYQMEIVKAKDLAENRNKLLSLEETAQTAPGWQPLLAAAANAWQGIKNAAAAWQPQAIGGAVLLAALAVSATFTLPAALLAASQLALVVGAMIFAYFVLTNAQTPQGLKYGFTLGVGMLAAFLSQQMGPWVMQTVDALTQAVSPVASGRSGYLSVLSALLLPVLGWVGTTVTRQVMPKGRRLPRPQGDDLIERAIGYSIQTFGFGKPEYEGTMFRTSVETVVERLKGFTNEDKFSPAEQAVMDQALRDPRLLGLLAIRWHQTPLTPVSLEGEDAALTPDEKMLAFVRDLAQGEELAALVQAGKLVSADLLLKGDSQLAQLMRVAFPEAALWENLAKAGKVWEAVWAKVPAENRPADLIKSIQADLKDVFEKFGVGETGHKLFVERQKALKAVRAKLNQPLAAGLPAEATAASNQLLNAVKALSQASFNPTKNGLTASTFAVGQGLEAAFPQRLLALAVMEKQAPAMARLAQERKITLALVEPLLSPLLGYHPEKPSDESEGDQAQISGKVKEQLAKIKRTLGEVQTASTVEASVAAEIKSAGHRANRHENVKAMESNGEKNTSEISEKKIPERINPVMSNKSAPQAPGNGAMVPAQVATSETLATKKVQVAKAQPKREVSPKSIPGKASVSAGSPLDAIAAAKSAEAPVKVAKESLEKVLPKESGAKNVTEKQATTQVPGKEGNVIVNAAARTAKAATQPPDTAPKKLPVTKKSTAKEKNAVLGEITASKSAASAAKGILPTDDQKPAVKANILSEKSVAPATQPGGTLILNQIASAQSVASGKKDKAAKNLREKTDVTTKKGAAHVDKSEVSGPTQIAVVLAAPTEKSKRSTLKTEGPAVVKGANYVKSEKSSGSILDEIINAKSAASAVIPSAVIPKETQTLKLDKVFAVPEKSEPSSQEEAAIPKKTGLVVTQAKTEASNPSAGNELLPDPNEPLAPVLQAAQLGIQPQQGPTWADQVRGFISNFRLELPKPSGLNLIPGIFRLTSQLSSRLRVGLLNALWSAGKVIPGTEVAWAMVVSFMGNLWRADLMDRVKTQIRGIRTSQDAKNALAAAEAAAAVPGVLSATRVIVSGQSSEIPAEIADNPALMHRLSPEKEKPSFEFPPKSFTMDSAA
ncbi:MAG: hypothetical protein HGA76_00500 [Candidatus Firestonebacteria bacterium]|nr:hypothetical protein [Candidatus Firestonebacteria bacterium]